MSGLQSLLLHVVVITPVCQYILTSGRFPRPRNFLFAVFFLAAVAFAGEWADWAARPPNFYRVLDVDRGASAAEMKKSYREQSLKFHPDKNKSPDAAAQFQLVNDAYEVLSDPEFRRLYERHGAAVVASAKGDARVRATLSSRGDMDTMVGMAGFYVIWGALTFLMTVGKGSGDARNWSFMGLVAMLMVEFQMVFGGFDPLSGLLTRTTLSEKVALLHALYPALMHGCRLIAQFTFVDTEGQLQALLGGILESNKEILVSLEQLIQATQAKKNKGGEGANSAAALASAGGAAVSGDGLRGDEALPLAARMKRRQEAEQRVLLAAQQKAAKSGGIPAWVIMAGLYMAFSYFSK